MSALPTFFVIGAARSGSTSLHTYLSQHPEIAMSIPKEPMYFQPPDWRERITRYVYDGDAAVRGESSTAYTAYPWAAEVPERVRATVPDAKLIYVVRDPIPRVLSHWMRNVQDDLPVKPFDELMADLEDPMNIPVWSSRYATQLERWLAHFPRERILVLDNDDLARHRRDTLQRVFAFLGVDPTFHTDEFERVHNRIIRVIPNERGRRLGAVGTWAARRPRLRPLVAREVPTPELRPDQRERLEALFAPEVARLRELTGLPLDNWSI